MWKRKNIAKALIVIGGFLCYMMADGCTFSIGIFYSEFLEVFENSKASTAVLPALIYALPQLYGPIICPFVDVAGSFIGSLLGGLILAISIFVSRFVISLQTLYVTMGVLTSVGLELTYVSAMVAVTKGFYDEKYLGLALGITVSGSGIGVFVFNPLISYLINKFTWKGALTIESAIFLNIIIAGILFKLSKTFNSNTKKVNIETISVSKGNIEIVNTQENNHSIIISHIPFSYSSSSLHDKKDNNKDEVLDEQTNLSIHSKPIILNGGQRSSAFLSMTQTKHCEPLYKPINNQVKSASLDRRINAGDSFSVCLPVDERSASFVRRLSLYSNQNFKGSHRESQESFSSKPSLLFENSENSDLIKEIEPNKKHDVHNDQDMNSISKNYSKLKLFKHNLKMSLLSLFSKRIWINRNLLLFYLISFVFANAVVVVWTFSYDHSLMIGIDETKAALLVSFIGAGSCIGQITFGFLSEYFPAILLYSIGCILSGVIALLLHSISIYWLLSVFHFAFGFGQGVCYALFSVILLHYTTIELFPASLGIFLVISGFGNLIGTSLSGYIYDKTGEYTVAYIISGCFLVLCSIISIPLIYFWYKETKNTKIIDKSNS